MSLIFIDNQFRCSASDYNATDQFQTRGGGLTGAADSKKGTVRFWLRPDGGDGVLKRIFCSTSVNFTINRTTGNKIQIIAENTSGTDCLVAATSSSITVAGGPVRFVASWDLAAAQIQFYLNDVSDIAITTNSDATIDYTQADWAFMGTLAGANLWNGCIGAFAIWFGASTDLSVEANHRMFFDAHGRATHLSVPSSVLGSPIAASDNGNLAVNQGTGGNFTHSGTALSACSTTPTD